MSAREWEGTTMFVPVRGSPRFRCLHCLADLPARAARFHRLRCKPELVTRILLNGVIVDESLWEGLHQKEKQP
jgi:hypothetical protein